MKKSRLTLLLLQIFFSILFITLSYSQINEENTKKRLDILEERKIKVKLLKDSLIMKSQNDLINYYSSIFLGIVEDTNNSFNKIDKQNKTENIANQQVKKSLEKIKENSQIEQAILKQKATVKIKRAKKQVHLNKAKENIVIVADGGCFFQSNSKIMTFFKSDNGRDLVFLDHPQFDLYCTKLTVFLDDTNQANQVKKANAQGNVKIISTNDKGEQQTAFGEKAVYSTNKDNVLILTGRPNLKKGNNLFESTSNETIVIMDEDGNMRTQGPSKITIIKDDKKGKK